MVSRMFRRIGTAVVTATSSRSSSLKPPAVAGSRRLVSHLNNSNNLVATKVSSVVPRQQQKQQQQCLKAASSTSWRAIATATTTLSPRGFSSSAAPPSAGDGSAGSPRHPLDAFRDPVPRQTRMTETVGRKWSVKELRRKSYDDLHKLWYVLYKERNMLLTEQQLSRRKGIIFPQPERIKKVRKSMGAIKHVLGERKREKIAAFMLKQIENEEE